MISRECGAGSRPLTSSNKQQATSSRAQGSVNTNESQGAELLDESSSTASQVSSADGTAQFIISSQPSQFLTSDDVKPDRHDHADSGQSSSVCKTESARDNAESRSNPAHRTLSDHSLQEAHEGTGAPDTQRLKRHAKHSLTSSNSASVGHQKNPHASRNLGTETSSAAMSSVNKLPDAQPAQSGKTATAAAAAASVSAAGSRQQQALSRPQMPGSSAQQASAQPAIDKQPKVGHPQHQTASAEASRMGSASSLRGNAEQCQRVSGKLLAHEALPSSRHPAAALSLPQPSQNAQGNASRPASAQPSGRPTVSAMQPPEASLRPLSADPARPKASQPAAQLRPGASHSPGPGNAASASGVMPGPGQTARASGERSELQAQEVPVNSSQLQTVPALARPWSTVRSMFPVCDGLKHRSAGKCDLPYTLP